uniref:Major latex protein-like protein n=1 Tax=Nepeta racemosa TaxID=54731 RepID=A0A7D3UM98_NEPRA|nr:major latex protein-like protein [Nepeta racemosa]
MASKLEIEIELKSDVEKMWKHFKEFTKLFPKACPHLYEKIDVIEGDGISVGTIFVSTLKPTELNPVVMVTKEKIDFLDDENKMLRYSYMEGEILKNYKNLRGTVHMSSSKSGGTIFKYSGEFEKANEQVPDPVFFKDFMVIVFQGLDDYILKGMNHTCQN